MLKPRSQKTSEKNHLALKSFSLSASLRQSLCTLSLSQSFLNTSKTTLECEYSFPLPNDSLISQFQVTLPDNTKLIGVLKETNSSKESYQDVLSSGNTSILTTLTQAGKFSVLIGNLSPKESLTIELSLIILLSCDSNFWKLSISSSILPSDPSCSFDFTAHIHSSSLQDYSSSLPLHWSSNEDSSEVVGLLTSGPVRVESEIWVKFRDELTTKPSFLVQNFNGSYYGMLSFIPYLQDTQSLIDHEGLGEFLFLLHRSGSMYGEKIEMAKQSLFFFLKSLPLNAFFNVVSFGSKFEFLFPESRKSDSLDEAIRIIQEFDADLGGTEMFDPLFEVYKKPCQKNHLRVIFLITDGEIDNPEKVLTLIKKNSDKNVLHSIGIGYNISQSFIETTAKLGKGSSFIVEDPSQICRNVIKALKLSILPCFSEWKLSIDREAYPTFDSLGSVFYGKRFAQFVKIDALPKQPACLEYFDSSVKQKVQVVISDFPVVPGREIAKLWTKYKMDELFKDLEKNADEIKAISVESEIPTCLTSFLCVKENDGKVVSEINDFTNLLDLDARVFNQHSNVTSCLSTNTGSLFTVFNILNTQSVNLNSNQIPCSNFIDQSHMYSKSINSPTIKLRADMNRRNSRTSECCSSGCCSLGCSSAGYPGGEELMMSRSEIEASNRPSLDPLPTMPQINEKSRIQPTKAKNQKIKNSVFSKYLSIVIKQHPEGFWLYNENIQTFQEISKVPQDILNKNLDILMTVFILAYLNHYHSSEHEEWELVERKALKWLRSNSVDIIDITKKINKFITFS